MKWIKVDKNVKENVLYLVGWYDQFDNFVYYVASFNRNHWRDPLGNPIGTPDYYCEVQRPDK